MGKRIVRTVVAKRMHNTKLMSNSLDSMEQSQKKNYIKGVALSNGITEEEALDLITTDSESEEYKGFDFISQIYDLRRRGKYKSADDLIRKHKNDLKEFQQQMREKNKQMP